MSEATEAPASKTKEHVFEVYPDRAGEWRWRLKNKATGAIKATPGEGYPRKEGAIHSAELIPEQVVGAEIVVLETTPEDAPEETLPSGPEDPGTL